MELDRFYIDIRKSWYLQGEEAAAFCDCDCGYGGESVGRWGNGGGQRSGKCHSCIQFASADLGFHLIRNVGALRTSSSLLNTWHQEMLQVIVNLLFQHPSLTRRTNDKFQGKLTQMIVIYIDYWIFLLKKKNWREENFIINNSNIIHWHKTIQGPPVHRVYGNFNINQ